ncbi:A-kinase anchor protein 17B-like [Hyperolius riggenbachi]|uniref:A-kinase anchor protein 17B-like n=1 Tax=Hyperolius riggenbachi TaxID=752182 RepID=UPI0035A34644
MTVIPVYDESEAVELCNTYHLFLKPRAKLIISVFLPEETDQCRPVSNWDILEQMKNVVAPDHFSSLRILKRTKESIRLEGETDTRQQSQGFLEKLNGQSLQTNNSTDPVRVEVTEAPLECLSIEETTKLLSEDKEDIEHNSAVSPCIHLEGLPCKWFLDGSSNTDNPSEEVLRCAFEKYGTIVSLDIPMLDPYREESDMFPVTPGGLQTFDAFLQFEDKSSTINAIHSLHGMKLMYAADDGKSLACDFKVSVDSSNHFSEEAVNKRATERLKLQELEQQRKQEKEEEERKRKMEEKKARARRRRARLKKKLQRQRREQKLTQQQACPEDAVEDTQEWEDRKLLLAQRRLESIQLLTVLLDKVNDLVQVNRLEEEQMNCEFELEEADMKGEREAVLSDFSVSTYSENSKVMSPHVSDVQSVHETEKAVKRHVKIKKCKDAEAHEKHDVQELNSHRDKTCQAWSYKKECPLFEGEDEMQDLPEHYYDHNIFKLSHLQEAFNNGRLKKRKIYETEEFINYLLNHYHYPEYARVFLETDECPIKTMGPRLVLWKGNSFQIKLHNLSGHFSEMNFIPELEEETEDDSGRWEEIIQEEPNDHSQNNLVCRETANEPQKILTEREHEVQIKIIKPRLPKSCEVECQKTRVVEDDCPSSETNSELRKVLEEISSTSEYFSEEFSETSGKRLKIKRASRKQRKLKQLKKLKQYSASGHSQVCHHKDILGHLLQSYFKKRSKCKLPKVCQRKATFHHQCDSETSESDSDTEVEVQRTYKRKRSKLKNRAFCLEEKNCKKELCCSSDSEISLAVPPPQKRNLWHHLHNGKLKIKKHKAAHINGKTKKPWDYCFAEDVSDSLEQEEESWIGEETQSSLSLSSSLQTAETEQYDIGSKPSCTKNWAWDRHFQVDL